MHWILYTILKHSSALMDWMLFKTDMNFFCLTHEQWMEQHTRWRSAYDEKNKRFWQDQEISDLKYAKWDREYKIFVSKYNYRHEPIKPTQ